MKIVMLVGLMMFLPLVSDASCLKDCHQETGTIRSLGPSRIQQQNETQNRNRSHDFGNNSTNILGNVKIHIGHEKIEIKGMENSTNSVIDASVSSSVILGNMKQ